MTTSYEDKSGEFNHPFIGRADSDNSLSSVGSQAQPSSRGRQPSMKAQVLVLRLTAHDNYSLGTEDREHSGAVTPPPHSIQMRETILRKH